MSEGLSASERESLRAILQTIRSNDAFLRHCGAVATPLGNHRYACATCHETFEFRATSHADTGKKKQRPKPKP